MGEGCTAEATRCFCPCFSEFRDSQANAWHSQRFQKLKKAGKEEFGEMAAGSTGAARKGKARVKAAGAEAGRTTKKASGKRKGKPASDAEDDEEGGETGESPERNVMVKAEDDGMDDEEGNVP